MNKESFMEDLVRTLIIKLSEGENIVTLDRGRFEHLFLFALQGVNVIRNITEKINEVFDYPEDSDGWKYVIGEELSGIMEEHLEMEGLDEKNESKN